mmetsp:Transcript_877/g.1627  ORF Transcript_877/g.1627 Transcript_877/m.1627 type:complete len:80 (+) Transcript_877:2260-2499(+)
MHLLISICSIIVLSLLVVIGALTVINRISLYIVFCLQQHSNSMGESESEKRVLVAIVNKVNSSAASQKVINMYDTPVVV